MKDFIDGINKYLEMTLNDEFTKIKDRLLKEVDMQMELKRNELVNNVLNAVDIQAEQTPLGAQFNISIEKIVKVVTDENNNK